MDPLFCVCIVSTECQISPFTVRDNPWVSLRPPFNPCRWTSSSFLTSPLPHLCHPSGWSRPVFQVPPVEVWSTGPSHTYCDCRRSTRTPIPDQRTQPQVWDPLPDRELLQHSILPRSVTPGTYDPVSIPYTKIPALNNYRKLTLSPNYYPKRILLFTLSLPDFLTCFYVSFNLNLIIPHSFPHIS